MKSIYVDHAATSPTHPDVVEAMLPFFYERFGNPSSIHQFGRASRHAVDEARATIARSIYADEKEIIFTSGGTESDNLALLGFANANRQKGNHIITTAIEHHALLHTCAYLQNMGFEISYLPVDERGRISIEDLMHTVREDTILVSVMYGNNEVGSLQPIKEIGHFLRERNIAFHTDAVQAYGIEEINVKELNIDFLSASAHKINGPKGVGFLYASNKWRIDPVQFGGEQERKRRAGTENVPGIVGFMEAVKIAGKTRDERRVNYLSFRKRMIDILTEEKIEFQINGDTEHFLPHVLNMSFPGVNIESLLVNLDIAGIAASSGSACTAGSIEPSHVLVAMFPGAKERMMSAIRFSFGFGNTIEQIEVVAKETAKIIKKLKYF